MTTEQVNIDAYITNVPDDKCTCENCKTKFDIDDEGFKLGNDWYICDKCFADKLEMAAAVIANSLRGYRSNYSDFAEAEDFLKSYVENR